MVLIVMSDTLFQLLPTTCPIPMEGIQGEHLLYSSKVMTLPARHRAYIGAFDEKQRHYLLEVDYARHPAALTLYYTDPIEGGFQHLLLPDGDVMLIGGAFNNNFTPSRTVWRLSPKPSVAGSQGMPAWLLWLLAILAVAVITLLVGLRRRQKRRTDAPTPDEQPKTDAPDPTALLMQRIRQLMSEDLLYLKPDLKLQDVALALHVNTRYISDCINSVEGTSFVNFVNGYRINHAKQLMRSNPDIKINTVWEASGFANESTFFRTFKAITGQTPREWIQETN